MTGAKIAILGAVGMSILPVGQLDPATMGLLDVFKAFGTTGLLLAGLVYVVRESKAQRTRMEELAAAETAAKIALAAALAEQAASTRTMNTILEDYRVTIEKCGGPGR